MTKTPNARDWLNFGALTAMWGAAYGLSGMALQGLPPEAVVAGRLTLAAIILNVLLRLSGERLAPFRDWRAWGSHLAQALTGFVLPFLAITHALEHVSTSLSALFLASVPLMVAGVAPFLFASERLNALRLGGVILGFVGMVVITGPEPLAELGRGRVDAQALLLASAVLYAMSVLVARATPPRVSPLVFATGAVSLGALLSLPTLFTADWSGFRPGVANVSAVLALAVFPSTLAQILYLRLIRATSAGFVAMNNYTVPVFAALVGVLLLGETLAGNQLVGFGVVLAGVWLSQFGAAAFGVKGGTAPKSP
jgi:drug/metabolite transporter (DMT)-like permease